MVSPGEQVSAVLQGVVVEGRHTLLGVVTVTFGSESVLPDFLDSLRRQTFRAFRLYAIDNASADASVAMLEQATDIDIRVTGNAGNVGVAQGNNQGIRQALADGCTHVLLLNNDTVFDAGLFLGLLLAAFSGNHRILVPKIHYDDAVPTIWSAGGWFVPWRGYPGVHYGAEEPDRGQFDVDRAVDYSPTCCMLVESSVFAEVGLMDEKYFVYYDDTDFCLRAKRLGIPIWYAHALVMRHKAGSLTGGGTSSFTARMSARNKVYYLRKNFGPLVCAWSFATFLVYITARALAGRDSWERYRLRLKAFVEGFSL